MLKIYINIKTKSVSLDEINNNDIIVIFILYAASTNYTRKPFVTTELTELRGKLKTDDYIFSNITFTCRADDLDNVYLYNVKWYIAELGITSATMKNLTKADIVNGNAKLHQKDWTLRFRPSFIVKCSLSVLGNGFSVPGPENFSEPFFAGIRVCVVHYHISNQRSNVALVSK